MEFVGSGSISFDSDPYSGYGFIPISDPAIIDTDPDSGSSQLMIRLRIQGNDTGTDSTDPDPHYWSFGSGPGFIDINFKFIRLFCLFLNMTNLNIIKIHQAK